MDDFPYNTYECFYDVCIVLMIKDIATNLKAQNIQHITISKTLSEPRLSNSEIPKVKINNYLDGLNWGPPKPKLRFMVGDKNNKGKNFNDFNSNLSLD